MLSALSWWSLQHQTYAPIKCCWPPASDPTVTLASLLSWSSRTTSCITILHTWHLMKTSIFGDISGQMTLRQGLSQVSLCTSCSKALRCRVGSESNRLILLRSVLRCDWCVGTSVLQECQHSPGQKHFRWVIVFTGPEVRMFAAGAYLLVLFTGIQKQLNINKIRDRVRRWRAKVLIRSKNVLQLSRARLRP